MTNENIKSRERYKRLELPGEAISEFWLERLGDRIAIKYSFDSPVQSGNGSFGAWSSCSQYGCLGEALITGRCLAHSDTFIKQQHLSKTAESYQILSLKGLSLSQALWDEIVDSPIFVNGIPIVPINFTAAEINATIRFNSISLIHGLDFTGANLFAPIELRECIFEQPLTARYCFFNAAPLFFYKTKFLKHVDISYSEAIGASLAFEDCTFNDTFVADGINGPLQLIKCEFIGNISFKQAQGTINLREALIHGSVDLTDADIGGFEGGKVIAKTVNRLGPCSIRYLSLPDATFYSRVHIDVVSDDINLSGSVLKEGGLIYAQSKSIKLSQVSIGGPLRVSGKLNVPSLPEIYGLLNSDAGQLSFARVDLTKCSFYGAHGLGNIDIESTVILAKGPWWAGKRRYIVDEFAWRANAGKLHSFGWKIKGVHVGVKLPKREQDNELQKILVHPLDAVQVAAIYRDLRRSHESKSDMPGSADFYFGEMEMRKWSTPLLERGLLWLYWLVSGYGMRANRALLSWFALITLGTYLMKFNGFVEGVYTLPRALLFSIRVTVPGVVNIENLTVTGQVIETILRIFGPILIALFLIAVRAKLMRKPSE